MQNRIWEAVRNMCGFPARSRVRIHGQVLFVCEETGDGWWIAECDQLNLTIGSDSFAGLVKDIIPTLDALFEDLRRTGDLKQVLTKNGLTVEDPEDLAAANAFDLPFVTDIRHDPTHAFAG